MEESRYRNLWQFGRGIRSMIVPEMALDRMSVHRTVRSPCPAEERANPCMSFCGSPQCLWRMEASSWSCDEPLLHHSSHSSHLGSIAALGPRRDPLERTQDDQSGSPAGRVGSENATNEPISLFGRSEFDRRPAPADKTNPIFCSDVQISVGRCCVPTKQTQFSVRMFRC